MNNLRERFFRTKESDIAKSSRKAFWRGFWGVFALSSLFEPTLQLDYDLTAEDGFAIDAKNIASDWERVTHRFEENFPLKPRDE